MHCCLVILANFWSTFFSTSTTDHLFCSPHVGMRKPIAKQPYMGEAFRLYPTCSDELQVLQQPLVQHFKHVSYVLRHKGADNEAEPH